MRVFKPFTVSSIFPEIERGKRIKKADQIKGSIPYASSTSMNNGIDGFIEATKGTRLFKDCISLANSGSVGSAFYEPFAFVASDHVTHLKNGSLNSNQYLYSTCVIEKQKRNFNFNREINDARIKRMRIMLPVNNDMNPDWEYISSFIKTMRGGMIMRYNTYVLTRLSDISYRDIPQLSDVQWGVFRIGDFFSVKRPSPRNKDDYEEGDIPFVASGASNNGVMKCCKPLENELLEQSGCISVSPVDGSSFYQPISFLGRGGAGSSVLLLYSDSLDMYNGQFIAQMIHKTCSKYSYGHMGNKDSIKREFVQLPIYEDGKPDFEYMEQFVKNMMIKKYTQYFEYMGLNKPEMA